MKPGDIRQAVFKAVLIVGLGLSLAACSWSVAGGMISALLTVLVSAVLVVGAGTSTSGCADPEANTGGADATLGDGESPSDIEGDTVIGPCLSAPLDAGPEVDEDVWIGPCLSPLEPDVPDIEEDVWVGPCLQPPQPDVPDVPPDVDEDVWIGPCLSPPEPDIHEPTDVGPCLSVDAIIPADTGAPDADSPDGDVGPCLSIDAVFISDIGPCLSMIPPDVSEQPDTGEADAPATKDVDLQPCLSLPPPDPEAQDDQAGLAPQSVPTTRGQAREAIRARLARQGVLPPDVSARLQGGAKTDGSDGSSGSGNS